MKSKFSWLLFSIIALAQPAMAAVDLRHYDATRLLAYSANPITNTIVHWYARDAYLWWLGNDNENLHYWIRADGPYGPWVNIDAWQAAEPWSGYDINIAPLWEVLPNGEGVKVGSVDTGIFTNHTDLAGLNIEGLRYYWTGTAWATNGDLQGVANVTTNGEGRGYCYHGSASASIIAARHDGDGSEGIAPGVDLFIVNVQSPSGLMYFVPFILGMEICATNGCNIITLSSSEGTDRPEARAVMAKYPNVLFVCASGNDNQADKTPDFANVISVSGCNGDGARTPNQRTGADIRAPGRNLVFPADPTGVNYLFGSGSSFAAPNVSGVAALLWKVNPNPSAIKAAIIAGADSRGNLDAWGAYRILTTTTYSLLVTEITATAFNTNYACEIHEFDGTAWDTTKFRFGSITNTGTRKIGYAWLGN
jgi:subtilisin family serine protease